MTTEIPSIVRETEIEIEIETETATQRRPTATAHPTITTVGARAVGEVRGARTKNGGGAGQVAHQNVDGAIERDGLLPLVATGEKGAPTRAGVMETTVGSGEAHLSGQGQSHLPSERAVVTLHDR
jgi:hypothetical protein